MSVRRKLKEMLAKGETILAPGAYDPITARVVEDLGFPAVYMGGYMTGAHLATTEPLMTLTEQVEAAAKVARAVNIPLICDADAGYGDPIHTMRCVREFESAGVAAIHIEDQVYPKRASYHQGREHTIPLDQFLEKIRYALQARQDPDFLIFGRTDAFEAVGGSMDEAIARGRELAKAGVDAIFPSGIYDREGLQAFRAGVPDIPLMTLGGINYRQAERMRELGYQIICYNITPIVTAVGAVREVYRTLKETGTVPFDRDRFLELMRYVEGLIQLPAYYEIESKTTER